MKFSAFEFAENFKEVYKRAGGKMKKVSKSKQQVIDVAKRMPPLCHTLPGTINGFDIRKSRTLWWLVKQPEVLSFIWEQIKTSGAIRYDADTGKWQGVDFVAEEDK